MGLKHVGLILAALLISGNAASGQKTAPGQNVVSLANGKLVHFGDGVVVVEQNSKTAAGNRTIALARATSVSVEMKVTVAELPPNARVLLGGKLNPTTLRITDWSLTYYADGTAGVGGGNGVTITEGQSDWGVKYSGVLQSTTPLRVATVRGTSYSVHRPVSKSTNPNQFGGNKAAPTSQEIRNPRRDLEGAVFTLELADAREPGVTVILRNQPQFAGSNATVEVVGVDGNPPVATSVMITRTEQFGLLPPATPKSKK